MGTKNLERLVGERSTAQKMKGKLEQIDGSSKNSTEITDLAVFFVKTCRLFLVLKRGRRHEAFLRVVAREHDARRFLLLGTRKADVLDFGDGRLEI